MGPENRPPTEPRDSARPKACAVRSENCICGVIAVALIVRTMKLVPDEMRALTCAPLKPPREASYGEVEIEAEIPASRGRVPSAIDIPFSVKLLAAASSPKTEKPAAPPSDAGM